MRRMQERRGNYIIDYYSVEITDDMKDDALNFANSIIETDNQYSRLLPDEIRNSNNFGLKKKIEIQRTYMGKLGELAFLKLLIEKGKNVDTDGMFEIYQGQNNVDSSDFITADSETVDIKTGYRYFHKRLQINLEQFNNIPKDYYVGVKINAKDVDSNKGLVDWEDIHEATVYGYADYRYMAKKNTVERDEGPVKEEFYSKLLGIDRLINRF